MLSIALMEAINNIECPIFIETGNSVPLKTTIQEKTLSPWIFEEVNFMNKLNRKRPTRLYNTHYFSADDRGLLLRVTRVRGEVNPQTRRHIANFSDLHKKSS